MQKKRYESRYSVQRKKYGTNYRKRLEEAQAKKGDMYETEWSKIQGTVIRVAREEKGQAARWSVQAKEGDMQGAA